MHELLKVFEVPETLEVFEIFENFLIATIYYHLITSNHM